MRRWFLLLGLVSVPAGADSSLEDYFLYSCVDAYLRQQQLPRFDGSAWWSIEQMDAGADALAETHEQASKFASTLPAPDPDDEEHGRPPILGLCLRASREINDEAASRSGE